jgi:hypothetical protein
MERQCLLKCWRTVNIIPGTFPKAKSYINYNNDVLASMHIQGMFKWIKFMHLAQLWWCSGSSCRPRNSLRTRSNSWSINGMDISVPMRLIFNGLYSFTQNNPQTCFIWTIFTSKLSWNFLPLTHNVIITGFQIILRLLEDSIWSKFNLKYSWQSKTLPKSIINYSQTFYLTFATSVICSNKPPLEDFNEEKWDVDETHWWHKWHPYLKWH